MFSVYLLVPFQDPETFSTYDDSLDSRQSVDKSAVATAYNSRPIAPISSTGKQSSPPVFEGHL